MHLKELAERTQIHSNELNHQTEKNTKRRKKIMQITVQY